MSGIIQIDSHRKKKEEREWDELDKKVKALEMAADAKKHTAESVRRVLAAMTDLNSAMANTPFGRQVAAAQKKTVEDFKNRFREVFNSAPDMPAARIKYFCGVLLKLWPDVEEGDWKARSLAYDDFFNAYMEGIDKAFSDWCRRDRKTEEMADEVESEYPFPQMLKITKENMGLMLSETLKKILSIRPEEGDTAKKEFLWELTKLFEIFRGILYAFSDEFDAQEAGGHEQDCCGMESRNPD